MRHEKGCKEGQSASFAPSTRKARAKRKGMGIKPLNAGITSQAAIHHKARLPSAQVTMHPDRSTHAVVAIRQAHRCLIGVEGQRLREAILLHTAHTPQALQPHRCT